VWGDSDNPKAGRVFPPAFTVSGGIVGAIEYRPLQERARWLKHADFFVGLSSGLSWLDQFRAAKVNWQLDLYSGTTHGFTNPQNPSEERADREYKVALTRFLKEVFSE
jgi:dienelactone hydrolase